MSALEQVLSTVGGEAAFETLAELMPGAAVFVVDGERNIVHWSRGAESMLGFSRAEVLGKLCLSGIRCRSCMLGCGVAEFGKIDGHGIDVYRKDGQILPTRKYARAITNEDGEFAGAIEVLVPVDEAYAEGDDEQTEPGEMVVFHGLVSGDPEMLRAFQSVRHIANSDVPVLVRGESGTGKENIARAVHIESPRCDGPFVPVNCAALTPALVESELFGHKKGAFTGAVEDRTGLFEQASGGTLFLDEVAELPLELQAKLLRVLEEGVVTPVGSSEHIKVDVRVVSATHTSLRQAVEEGRFREDLMFRLRVVPIFLPPLRERRNDIGLLVNRLLEDGERFPGRERIRVAPAAMRMLLDHDWPGNVRELKNVVDYARAVGNGVELKPTDLPPEFSASGRSRPESSAKPSADAGTDEKNAIRQALKRAGGKVGDAAALLGMSRPTFWRKRKKYGL